MFHCNCCYVFVSFKPSDYNGRRFKYINFFKKTYIIFFGVEMSIDLTDLSAKQLIILIKAAQKQHSLVTKRASIDKVRTALTKAAKVEGYTIEELFAKVPSGRSRKVSATKMLQKAQRKAGKISAKYRNPSNKDEVWAGRGKRPRWLTELVASGKKIEDFLIKRR